MGGPNRATFTLEEPANYPVFNSIKNHTGFGDERGFVRIREAGAGKYGKEINIVPGKEYEVYILVHNNAKSRLNDIILEGGIGIARDVRLSAIVPKVVKKGERRPVSSVISAANTNPKEVWDEAYVTASVSTTDLRYVPGSAIIHSNGAVNGRVLPDSLFSERGTFLGYDNLNGVIPGGLPYSSYIIYRLKADAPNFSVSHTVSKDGKAFSGQMAVASGDVVFCRVVYTNTGTTDQMNVNVKAALPEYMTYVPGSARIVNNANPNGLNLAENVSTITGGGINIGGYGAGASATITFRAKIAASKNIPRGTRQLASVAYAITGNGTKQDEARIIL
jgi:uncharacterized repeat protein (TIGR01451 family)